MSYKVDSAQAPTIKITSMRDQVGLNEGFQINLEGGVVRPVHFDLFPTEQFCSLMMAWSEENFTIVSRLPPRANGPKAHWHDVDQLFYCLRGSLEMQVGEEPISLRQGELVLIPAGTPHSHRNAADVEEVHLEMIVPGVVPGRPVARAIPEGLPWRGRGRVTRSKGDRSRPITDDRGLSICWTSKANETAHAEWTCAEVIVNACDPVSLPVTEGVQMWYVMEGRIDVVGAPLPAGPDHIIYLDRAADHDLKVPAGIVTRAFVLWPVGGELEEKLGRASEETV